MLFQGGVSFGSLSLDSIWGRPAAVINGESISRAEFKERVKSIQTILERQHGREVFEGNRGRTLLSIVEREVLGGLIEEKLMTQEARKLRIQIDDQQVKQELVRIAKEIFGTSENYQARLRESGVFQEDLENHLRFLALVEALKEAKGGEANFDAWLRETKKNAKLVIYNSGGQRGGALPILGNCCGLGNPGGCSGARTDSGQPVDPQTERQAQKAALQAFQKTHPGDKDLTAKVTDYGCHIQVDILKEGRVVKSYSYQDGEVFEIS